MQEHISLSELVGQIQDSIQTKFEREVFWISARIMNVKKYETNRRCYLNLEEYQQGTKTAEMKAVFWANYYSEIEKFEKYIKQPFKDGTEIICKVKVRFHKVYGLNLDVLQIDVAHTLGTLELERQKTIEKLLKENSATIQLFDGVFRTYNNRLSLPLVIEKIALITAPASDGQRDFQQEITKNKHNYSFLVTEFLTTIQGDNAHKLILEQLQLIEKSEQNFDVVAIVRGGGSLTDFKPFDDYELSAYVANFPIPVFSGIGHDRNQSIVDLMAREHKTPTKVASTFVEHNFEFENNLIELKEHFFELVKEQIQHAEDKLNNAKRIVKLSSPQAILNRGFAIVMSNDKIVIDPKEIQLNSALQIMLKDETIYSTVTKKTNNENRFDI
ncbi:MAG: exodeoxyribonuclease VII large subunit [Ferruginibacter sp.]